MQRRNDGIDMKHWENCKPSNRSFLEEDVKQLKNELLLLSHELEQLSIKGEFNNGNSNKK